MKKGIEKINKTTFYKTNPSGISLIVLVITIIVIIILATAIIVSIVNNNPIIEANKARYESDRDNMQSIFTNTLAKVMADKKVSIGVIAGELNSVKSGVDKTVGEASYTINGEVVGSIIFDDIENKDNDYYTGRQLPIYKKETTWHVDSEGILRLQVGEKMYGEGTIDGDLINQSIIINSTVTISSDFTKATLSVIIEYDGELDSVTINGEKLEVVKNSEGKYVASKEVDSNGNYIVVARAKDGSVNKEVVTVSDITEDMEIWNRADMELFRDKVNSGRTFEGRKAIVMDDIYLEGNENNQWNPITGNFAGIFEGNKHKITDLYISSNAYRQLGLFCTISDKSKIQNTILENVYINNTCSGATISTYTGGFAGHSYGEISNCGVNSGTIKASNLSVSTSSWPYATVGGIVGVTINAINGCYNNASISAERPKSEHNAVWCGGIAGHSRNNVQNCYNSGIIRGDGGNTIVGGVIGDYNNGKIINSYNIGSVSGSGRSEQFIGGLIGRIGFPGSNFAATISNSYNLNSSINISYFYYNNSYRNSSGCCIDEEALKTYATKLGSEYTDDTTNINGGYPILKWQLEK